MQSIQLATLNVDELRTRLRKISDEELRKFGKAARYMVSPTANMGNRCRAFVLQLEEARAEWRRRCRGPRLSSVDSPCPLRMTPERTPSVVSTMALTVASTILLPEFHLQVFVGILHALFCIHAAPSYSVSQATSIAGNPLVVCSM
jgi:hypothetical protein